jgi:hypothetical protein
LDRPAGVSGSHVGNRLKADVTYCYPPSCGSNYFMALAIRVPPTLLNSCTVNFAEGEATCYIEPHGSSPRGTATFTDIDEFPGRTP